MIRGVVVGAATVALVAASTALGLAVAVWVDRAGYVGAGVPVGVGLASVLCAGGMALILRATGGGR